MIKNQKELPMNELSVKAPKELSAALGSWFSLAAGSQSEQCRN
jgi:hypothetical protein